MSELQSVKVDLPWLPILWPIVYRLFLLANEAGNIKEFLGLSLENPRIISEKSKGFQGCLSYNQ